jgi:hypothetical protein
VTTFGNICSLLAADEAPDRNRHKTHRIGLAAVICGRSSARGDVTTSGNICLLSAADEAPDRKPHATHRA